VCGENAVIRVLAGQTSLGDLGSWLPARRRRRDGGDPPHRTDDPGHRPHGSGKTTTLYSFLTSSTPGLERHDDRGPGGDPPPLASQVQVHTEIGMTFAGALRVDPASGPRRDPPR
jgi:hypothetical protein